MFLQDTNSKPQKKLQYLSGLLAFYICTGIAFADDSLEDTTSLQTTKSETNKTESSNLKAKNYSLDAVTTTARGTEQLVKDAPASITVINRDEIEKLPHRDLAETLANIPGVDVGTELGKTGGLKISIRGMPSDYTLILIDGKRQNVAADINTNNAGWSQANTSFMPPVSAIERIEVIRGPMSTLYGSDAIGGVINIITRKKIDKSGISFGLETTQNEHREYGSGYIANLFTTMPIIKDVLGIQLRGRYYYRGPSNVQFTYTNFAGEQVTATPGFIGSPTEAHIYDVGGRILWNPNDQNNIYFDVESGRQWYDNSREQLGQFTSTASNYIVMRNNYILSHTAKYNKFSMDNSLQFNQSWNDGRMTNTNPNNPRKIAGKDVILESKSFIDLPYNNSLSVGWQYWFSWAQDMVAKPSQFYQHTLALFAEDEWEIIDGFKVNVALREDWNNRFGFNTSPKLYMVYNPLDDLLIFKGGFTMGYKAPTPNQLIDGQYGFGNQGKLAFLGNPNLRPETSLSFELTAMSNNDYIDVGGTYFYTFFYDKITLQSLSTGVNPNVCGSASFTAGCSQVTNVDQSYIQGFEFFANTKPFYGVTLDIAYTFTDSKQLSGSMKGYPLSDMVDHMFSSKLTYSYNPFSVWIRGQVYGNRFRGLNPASSAAQIAVAGAYYKPYGLLDIGATYRFNEHFRFQFGIYNLLDTDFADYRQYGTNGNTAQIINLYNYIQEGRKYYLSINMDF